MTTLLQCGVPEPTGIVKWTGVRFSDFAELVGVQPPAHYCRIFSNDRYWVGEEMPTMMHPQVMPATTPDRRQFEIDAGHFMGSTAQVEWIQYRLTSQAWASSP